MGTDRADLDRLVQASEKVLAELARRDERGTVPLVYPAGTEKPEPRWIYMGGCKYCGSLKPFKVFWKLKAFGPIEYGGPGGTQPRAAVQWWPYAMCESCEHVSEGQVTGGADEDADDEVSHGHDDQRST